MTAHKMGISWSNSPRKPWEEQAGSKHVCVRVFGVLRTSLSVSLTDSTSHYQDAKQKLVLEAGAINKEHIQFYV